MDRYKLSEASHNLTYFPPEYGQIFVTLDASAPSPFLSIPTIPGGPSLSEVHYCSQSAFEFEPKEHTGVELFMMSKFSACFVLKIAPEGRGEEKGGNANLEKKHTQPLTFLAPCILYFM